MNLEQLQDEITNLQTRLEDKLIEVNVLNKCGNYKKAADCGREIIHIADQLHMRTTHLNDSINFYGLVKNLQARGISAKAVKRYANQS